MRAVDDAPALSYLSSALEEPAPRYVAARDSVVAFHQPHFGRHRWELPLWPNPLAVDHPSACGAFAAALLAGAVATPMGDVRERLAGKPSVCARPEGRSQKLVVELVASLQRRGVASKSALATQWRKDPRYLLPEMLGWMKSGQGYALEKLWPKIVASTVQGVAVVKAIEPSAAGVVKEHHSVEHRKRREDEKSAGGAGAGCAGFEAREGGQEEGEEEFKGARIGAQHLGLSEEYFVGTRVSERRGLKFEYFKRR